MAFNGLAIFPGMSMLGIVSPQVIELAVTFNIAAVNALQTPAPQTLAWAEQCSNVTPGVDFRAKIPIDLTSLDGFEEFAGQRHYKQVDLSAITVDVQQFQRNLQWDMKLVSLGQVYGLDKKAAAMVDHARRMRARMCATVLMGGTPTQAKALTLPQPGAANGLSLFNTGHFSNPLSPSSTQFSNYYAAAGKFTGTTLGTTLLNMRMVPSPASTAETLGLEVTDIIGPSHMAEVFRKVAVQQLALETGTGAANVGVAATTSIYATNMQPWRFWIAPQLDNDPYLVAYKLANPSWTPTTLAHMWIAVSKTLPGANPIEMAAPTAQFTPTLQFFGDGSEMAAQTRKVHLLADLDCGAAAGLYHVVARYEET